MKRWSVVCDFPAQPADESADQRAGQSASSYDDLEVGGEENLDAYYAAGALALGVGLSAKPRRKARQETVETPPVGWLKSAGRRICWLPA